MSAFDDLCRRAATDFLQTVVLVDDMAEYSSTALNVVEGELVEPDMFVSVPAAAEAGEVAIPEKKPSEAPLDASAVSRSFAQAGLVCSILRPSAQDKLEEEVLIAAARADIVVLDWQMNDEGALAITIIRRLVEQDDDAGGRLRLIAIYTGKSPLTPVRDELQGSYQRLASSGDEVALRCGSTKVIFLTKATASVIPGEAGLSVGPAELASRLVQEFASFAGGFLPNAVLATIAGVRSHTHKVLARFNKTLDGPFLTHRALLNTPMDAEQYAVTLITAELDSQVPLDRIASDYLGMERVREYIDHRMQAGLKPRLMLDKAGNKLQELTLDKSCQLIEEGMTAFSADEIKKFAEDNDVQNPGTLPKTLRDELPERLYALLDDDVQTGRANHEQFAIAAKIKRDASSIDPSNPGKLPQLHLGTLLLDDSDEHWLCVTPLCDSERIPAVGGRFMFALLKRVDDHGEFLIRDGAKIVQLSPEMKRIKIATFVFLPDDNGVVRGAVSNGVVSFTNKADPRPPWSDSMRFRWLGELKPLQAQRFASRLANSLSRIGLDDFEWHRMRELGSSGD